MYSQAPASTSSVSDSTKYEPASGSAVAVTPDSNAMICWVRSAIFAACSVGRPSASSKPLVWRLCVPPSTAASAWSADAHDVVLRLLRGEHRTGGLGVEAQELRLLVLRAEALRHDPVPHAPRGPELRDLFEEVVVPVPEERQARRELVDVEAGVDRGLHVRDPVRQRERDLLHRGAAGFADVVAGDRDRVPLRDVVAAVGEDVGDDPHRLTRRVDVGAARDVLLEQVVLDRPADLLRRTRPASRRRARRGAAGSPRWS